MTATLSLQIKCDVTAEYRPKVLVVSHERSGTHFVMNSLALNLDYVSSPWINLALIWVSMQKIANFLGLPMSRKPVRPDRNDKVVYPSPEPLEPMEGFPLTASDLVFVENATRSTYEMISRLN